MVTLTVVMSFLGQNGLDSETCYLIQKQRQSLLTKTRISYQIFQETSFLLNSKMLAMIFFIANIYAAY